MNRRVCRRDAMRVLAALPLGAAGNRSTPIQALVHFQLRLGEHFIGVDFDDSPTSRDLISLLPLALELEDYATTEKIAYPPRKLVTKGAPVGMEPKAGDLAYYAPCGTLALFHRDFRYSEGLIRLGRLRGGLTLVARTGKIPARLEHAPTVSRSR